MDETIKNDLERLIEEGVQLLEKTKSNTFTYDQKYKEWEADIQMWTKVNYPSEEKSLYCTINYEDLESIVVKLKAMQKYPMPILEGRKISPTNVFNISQSQEQKQEQSQSQKILQKVFIEAIKDELTGKQQKEIQAILDEHKDNIEEAKPKLLEKLASFGTNVLAGVVGNILTNPAMIGLF